MARRVTWDPWQEMGVAGGHAPHPGPDMISRRALAPSGVAAHPGRLA